MTVVEYVTIPATGKAVEFTGTNVDEIREFAGDGFLHAADGIAWVMTADGPAGLHPGWLAAREGDALMVYSAAAFSHHTRRASPAPA